MNYIIKIQINNNKQKSTIFTPYIALAHSKKRLLYNTK